MDGEGLLAQEPRNDTKLVEKKVEKKEDSQPPLNQSFVQQQLDRQAKSLEKEYKSQLS